MQPKLSAIHQGLKLAMDLGDYKVELESNLLEAVNLIKQVKACTHGIIIMDI